jgi:hypothetical protein
VLSGLPPVTTTPDFITGQPSECDYSDRAALNAAPSDFYGRVNFSSVFAWWQPPAADPPDGNSEE